jgi:HAD superfamily hydrolase (TIGR01509 family)
MQKTYVWDIDGVLIRHHPSDPMLDWRSLLAKKKWLGIWESFQASELWADCLVDHAMNVQEQLACFMRQRGENVQEAGQIIGIWLQNNVEVNQPAYQCLLDMRARGYPCAIASNQDVRRAGFLTSWFSKGGLSNIPYFISCDMRLVKPDRRFFRKIENALGADSRNPVLLDDRLENINAAMEAGWQAHHITPGFDWRAFREGISNGAF